MIQDAATKILNYLSSPAVLKIIDENSVLKRKRSITWDRIFESVQVFVEKELSCIGHLTSTLETRQKVMYGLVMCLYYSVCIFLLLGYSLAEVLCKVAEHSFGSLWVYIICQIMARESCSSQAESYKLKNILMKDFDWPLEFDFPQFPWQHERLNTILKFLLLLSLRNIRSLDFSINLHTAYYDKSLPFETYLTKILLTDGFLDNQ